MSRHALVLATLALAGCGHLQVGPATPTPNVAVAADKAPAALVLADAVADAFTVPETGSIRAADVKGWRGTIEAAYASAFPGTAGTGRRLELLSVVPSFAPAQVSPQYGVVSVVAQVRYKARLLDASGAVVAVNAGTVSAREPTVHWSDCGPNAALAVEAMFEEIASVMLR
jgi:hypothetical protein